MDTIPTPALDKFLSLPHRLTCTYWIFSGDRHCSCGRDAARVELDLVPTEKAAKTFVIDDRDRNADAQDQGSNRQKDGHKSGYVTMASTIGWRPNCVCVDAANIEKNGNPWFQPVPCRVFDPFSGSGTTMMVARQLGRDGIGMDLSMKYIQECAMERLGMDDLQEWLEGKKAEGASLSDLPMFAGLE